MTVPINVGFFYDFDLTLSDEFQQYPILRKYNEALKDKYDISTPEDYWKLCIGKDPGVSWMAQFLRDAQDVFENITNDRMEKEFAKEIALAPGIPLWFDRIKEYGIDFQLDIRNHIISSGCVPLIRGTKIDSHVDSITAGEFLDNGEGSSGINSVVYPFLKVNVIKNLCKGPDIYADIAWENYIIRHDHTFVLGDGQSDKDMFRYVLQRGGFPVAVFKKGDMEAYKNAKATLETSVRIIAPRDYFEGSTLDKVIKENLEMMKEKDEHCDMDSEIVHNYRIGHVSNPEIKNIVKKHLDGCKYCNMLNEKKFYAN